MNKPMHIAVIFGGYSSEYEVSLQSASALIHAIDTSKYNLTLVGITREGQWLHYSGDPAEIATDNWWRDSACMPALLSPDRVNPGLYLLGTDAPLHLSIDVVFPVLHGRYGEDGSLQGLLELSGIPYVGCGVLSSAVCMDKDIARQLVQQAGITTATAVSIPSDSLQEQWAAYCESMQYPLFVKPANAGSSIGIQLVQQQSDLIAAMANARLHDRKVVIEQAVPGFEVGCAILGNDALIIGDIDQIELTHGFFDFHEKYHLETASILLPARLDADTVERVKHTAQMIYRALDCRGLARVDLFVTPDHQIVFNEVNTLPGFTAQSRYPSMLRAIGMTFPQLIDQLIDLAVQR